MALIRLKETELKNLIKESINEVVAGWPMHFRNIYDDIGDGYLINEGLIKTYPLTFVEKYFKGRYLWDILRKDFIEDEYKIFLTIDKNSTKEEEIEKVLNNFGYYLAYKTKDDKYNTVFQFEPKFQNTFTVKDLLENDIKYFLHVSPFYNREKILKNGLTPVSKNNEFDYPSRVYLFIDGTPKHIIQSMVNKLSRQNNNPKNNGNYTLYRIDFNGLENIKFNTDFNAEYAVFTSENIPPSNIQEIGQIRAGKDLFKY